MRAWNYSALAVLVIACGGSESTLDGGNDANVGNDVNTTMDTGPGNDASMSNDSSNGTDGDSSTTMTEAGPFDPSDLGSDLVLWLDAAKGVTLMPAVETWADQTSYHNDASGGTGTGAHQPTVNATAINALPAVTFTNTGNGASQYLEIADSTSLQFGTGDFAVFMVAEYTNTTTGGTASQATFYWKVAGTTTPTGPQLYGNAGTGTTTLDAQVRSRLTLTDNIDSAGTMYNDAKFHRIGIRRNGSALEVWTDGVSASFTPDASGTFDVGAVGTDVYIGAQPEGNGVGIRLQGAIAEVIGVNGTLSASDVTNLDGYFTTKYAL